MKNHSWNIRRGRIVDPTGNRDEIADLFVRNGIIAASETGAEGPVQEIDAQGLTVIPGLLDLHVHFREPGGESSETVASGSQAAAHGGFTAVVAMPNPQPPVDTPERVRRQVDLGRAAGPVRVWPSGCLTQARQGRVVADLAGMAEAGAIAFTDDGQTVPATEVMRAAMVQCATLRRPLLDHALDAGAAGAGIMHEGPCARRLRMPGIPSSAESRIVERDIALCRETGCTVHIQHVSARASVEQIAAARRAGLPVSGEVTPHHLWFTDARLETGDPNYKMNPPLRSEEDRQALLAALADGTLTALATDHAPHAAPGQSQSLQEAPFGIIGLETAVPATYTVCVHSGLMPLMEWVHRWTTGPAAIIGLPAPALSPGQPANIVLLDLDAEIVPDPTSFLSKSTNSPFVGMSLRGRVVHTLHEGRTTWRAGHHD